MAEKRRLPPRDRRESAAKRRVSEAAPQSSKKKAPTPRAPSPLEPVDAPLPTSLKDVEGLPVLRARQPLTLSDKEYQSIAERYEIAIHVTVHTLLTVFVLNL